MVVMMATGVTTAVASARKVVMVQCATERRANV